MIIILSTINMTAKLMMLVPVTLYHSYDFDHDLDRLRGDLDRSRLGDLEYRGDLDGLRDLDRLLDRL